MESPYAQSIKKNARQLAVCQIAQTVSFLAVLIGGFITPTVFFIALGAVFITLIVSKVVADKAYDLAVSDFKWTAKYYAKQGVQVESIINKLE